MPMKSLPQLRTLMKEPQLMHKWLIEVPIWPSIVQPANADILFMITSAGLPEIEYENVMVELGTYKMSHNANENRNGKITWTLFDNTDSDIIKYFFIDFANKRKNHTSNSNITPAAAKSSELIVPIVNMNLLAADGVTVTKQCQLIDCLFQPANFGGELGQEATVQKPVVDVVYDSFIWLKV